MGNAQDLKTVAADVRGQTSRKYESAESARGLGPLAAATTKLLLTMALVKNLFWGSSEAPADSAQLAEEDHLAAQPIPDANIEAGDELTEPDSAKAAESGNSGSSDPVTFKARALSTVQDTEAPEDEAAARQSPFGRMQPIPSNDNHDPHSIAPFNVGQSIKEAAGTPHGGGGTEGGMQPVEKKGDKTDKTDDAPQPRSNRAPVVTGAAVLHGLQMNHAAMIGLTDLLQNVSDPDGDRLTVTDLNVSSGTLSALGNGTWFFTPEIDDSSEVTFSYKVTDGIASVSQFASMDLLPEAAANNLLVGTEGPDTIYATSGNDVIEGLGGEDVIFAADGDDIASGGNGDDIIYGGFGDDLINGGNGNDIIFAGSGNDRVFAGAGDDVVFGGSGNDIIRGEDGIDVLFGEDGDDVLHGGADRDVLIGGAGSDVARGDAGSDTFVATTQDGNDNYDGGSGVDTLDLSATTAPATIDLALGSASSADIGNDSLTSIENAIGSSGDDIVIGNEADNVLMGGAGEDVAQGNAGADIFVATAHDGNDSYDGGSGADTLDLSATTAPATIDLALGSASSADIGNDSLTSIENAIGSSGDDIVIGNEADNVLMGGAGGDVARGDAGSDTFVATAHDGNDSYDGGSGVDTLDLSATTAPATIDLALGSASSADIGSDSLTSIENAIGSSGDDVIIASTDRNILTGGSGNDTFVFSDLASSPGTNDLWDLIRDFSHGDRLDVSFVDANRNEDGHQTFSLRLEPSSSGQGSNQGSIRFRYEQADDGEHTIVRGYVDEDDIADLLIDLLGRHNLSESDFVLEWHP